LYFPTTAIVWLLYVRENGSSDEIPVVNEGIVGISLASLSRVILAAGRETLRDLG
jgi:hypothetical protein